MDSSDDDPGDAGCEPQSGGGQFQSAGLSRRKFIHRGTLTAAAVGVATSVPGWSGLLTSGVASAPAAEEDATQVDGEMGAVSQPLFAQVKDLSTGEISVFQGEREVIIRDTAVANRLFSAARP
jgi:hypothetical protein